MKQLPLIAALAIFASVACGDNKAPPVDSQSLCGLYTQICQRQAECGVFILSSETSVEACTAQLDCALQVEDAADSDIIVNEENVAACSAEIAAASCEELIPWLDGSATQFVVASETCQAIFEGTHEEGDSCILTAECAPGLACEGTSCPGTCEVAADTTCTPGGCLAGEFCSSGGCEPRRGQDEECDGDGFLLENSCTDGLHCLLESFEVPATCVPQVAPNGACENATFFTCADDNICGLAGTCVDPTPIGSDCSYFLECGFSAFCDFESASQICQPTKAAGATCSGAIVNECGLLDCVEGTCAERSEGTPTRETRPFVGDGADCLDANCGPGLVCWPNDDATQFRCQPKFELGEVCMPATDIAIFNVLLSLASVSSCSTGFCDIFANTWTCVQPAAPGEQCSSPGLTLQCQSAICLDGECTELYPNECPQ